MQHKSNGKTTLTVTGFATPPDRERAKKALESALVPIIGPIEILFNGAPNARPSVSTEQIRYEQAPHCAQAIKVALDRTCPVKCTITW